MAAFPLLLAQGGGSIVNIGALGAPSGQAGIFIPFTALDVIVLQLVCHEA